MNFGGQHFVDRVINSTVTLQRRHSGKAGGDDGHIKVAPAAASTRMAGMTGAIVLDLHCGC